MSQRGLWTGACALVMLLLLPSAGSAGILEIIAEMSGPKMWGFSFDCRLDFTGTWQSCRPPILGVARAADVTEKTAKNLWISLAGGYYWSADKTVNGQDYDRFEVKMLTFDPMLEFASVSEPLYAAIPFQIYHGPIGLSYNLLFGAAFPTFSNVGVKVKPIGIVIPVKGIVGVDVSYDFRLYTRRFTAEDFGHIPIAPEGNGAEVVRTFAIGIRLKLD